MNFIPNKNPSIIQQQFDTTPYECPGLTSNDIFEIKKHFDFFDRSKSGLINATQLKQSLSELGPQARNQTVYQILCNLSADGAGCITFPQFLHLMTPRLLPRDTHQNINMIFQLFDEDKTGYISAKNLKKIAHQLHIQLSQQDIMGMISWADQDNDGLINCSEFERMIRGQTQTLE